MTAVETTAGRVEGVREQQLHVFRGIPYAQPPVGELRLRAPRPVEPWAGVRPATTFGCWAPQDRNGSAISGDVPGEIGEECLTLNVWTPGTDDARRPVMVWIHGGGFTAGSAAARLYAGQHLAARGDVVVVSVNYRLGVLGFLAGAALTDEAAGGACGNWGLLDQVLALQWVRDNVAAFGGDPGNVTIFGESAGSMSVADLLTMPAARGLFHKAIAQSGPPAAMSLDRAEETTAKLLAEVGVTDVAQLREVELDRLLEAQAALLSRRGAAGLPLMPVVDEVSLPVAPQHAIADGCAADIPLVAGTNRDEAKLFMIADPKNRDPDDGVLHRRIERAFAANEVPLRAEDVIARYREIRAARGEPTDPRELWSAIETDRMFRIGSVRATEAQSRHQPKTFSYLFTWESPAMGAALGSCHALELPFVFGTLGAPTMDRFAGAGPAVEQLSSRMMDAWLAFARTGDPSTAEVQWPAYDAQRRATYVFGPECGVVDAPYEEERQVWMESS